MNNLGLVSKEAAVLHPWGREALLLEKLLEDNKLRSNNGLRLSLCKSLAMLGDRSFYVAAPILWNDLP